MIEPDFLLSSYNYHLPEELIAQKPLPRGSSRLLALERNTGKTSLASFADLAKFLQEPCLFVANNSKVVPARLQGKRPSGGKAEFLLLTPLPLVLSGAIAGGQAKTQAKAQANYPAPHSGQPYPQGHGLEQMEWVAEVEGLLKPAKKLGPGTVLEFGANLRLKVLEQQEFGQARALLGWNGGLDALLEELGSLPLPPYIRRDAEAEDGNSYQTFYASAQKSGSVAAPTAGLHFTPQLRDELLRAGHKWAELTLYVGYGTFSPVRVQDIREHKMHPEFVELGAETARQINEARKNGIKILTIGTTATRVVEGVAALQNGADGLEAYNGWLNAFIYPGRPFRVVDKMITNFHLPESTLLMLVSALAGRENILRAYEQAVRERFRFFSYGDAMLIY